MTTTDPDPDRIMDGFFRHSRLLAMKGQECQVDMFVGGERLDGLQCMSLTEARGVATSVWKIVDATQLPRVEAGVDLELRTRFADPRGNVQPCVWTGRVVGLGLAGRSDFVTVTIEGVRREWGESE